MKTTFKKGEDKMNFLLKHFYNAIGLFFVISILFFSIEDVHAGYVDTVANFEIGGRVYFHDHGYEEWGWFNVPTNSISTSSWSELENFMNISNFSGNYPEGLIYTMRYPFAGGYLVTFDLIWTANFPFHLEITTTEWDGYISTIQILTPYADQTDPYDPDLPESYPPFAEFILDGNSFQIVYRKDEGGTFTGTLSYTLYQDGDPSIDLTSVHICPDSKHIASIPVPAGVWLMSSGMTILIGLRRRT